MAHSIMPKMDNPFNFAPDRGVFFIRFFRVKKLKVGDLVKVKHPELGILVKYIKFIDRNGLFWLHGKNDSGRTTLQIGPIRARQIIGKALIWR